MPQIQGRYVPPNHSAAIAHRAKFPEQYETAEDKTPEKPVKKVRAKKKGAETAAVKPAHSENAEEI